jgi:hypothetical protein
LRDEIEHFAKRLPHVLEVRLLKQGLHNDPPQLRQQLQQTVNDVEANVPGAQAIALGYGLCSRGVEGVSTQRCRLVMARAHDCITLLLGDKDRYAEYAKEHPGTYWYSPGWNRCHTPPGPTRYNNLLKIYREKFGDEDAEFLMETEQAWFKTYDRAAYVDVGVAALEADVQFTRECADWLGWKFDQQKGSSKLIEDLLGGFWDNERFLVLEPGQTAQMTADGQVVRPIAKDRIEEKAQ